MKISHNIFLIFYLVLSFSGAYAKDNFKTNNLSYALGDNENIIIHSTTAVIGKLKVSSAVDAQNNALKDNKLIVGYSIVGDTSVLNEKNKSKIIKTLLNNNNYISTHIRCLNKYFLGIRFLDDNHKVEFALGMPCQQAIWVFKKDNKTESWGANLTNNATKEVFLLFNKKNKKQYQSIFQ